VDVADCLRRFRIGFSMVNAPITNAAVSGMPDDRGVPPRRWPRPVGRWRQSDVALVCAVRSRLRAGVAGRLFAAAAKPLWFVCAGLGVVILRWACNSTAPRAFRSAERLAPLVAVRVHQFEVPVQRNRLADEFGVRWLRR